MNIFINYRIKRLQIKVDGQKARTEKLTIAAGFYKNSYYTDQLIDSHCKLVELSSELKWLKDKKAI